MDHRAIDRTEAYTFDHRDLGPELGRWENLNLNLPTGLLGR
jgi:hypothetical protein